MHDGEKAAGLGGNPAALPQGASKGRLPAARKILPGTRSDPVPPDSLQAHFTILNLRLRCGAPTIWLSRSQGRQSWRLSRDPAEERTHWPRRVREMRPRKAHAVDRLTVPSEIHDALAGGGHIHPRREIVEIALDGIRANACHGSFCDPEKTGASRERLSD